MANTVVVIQPITATAPGALGLGYRLAPEGVTFAQPVMLRFGYAADETAASDSSSLRVATRDARGSWQVTDAVRDTTQRTLSVTTSHFSDWSYVAGVQIVPASATVAVNKEQRLRVIDCGDGPDLDGGNSAQRLLLECRTDDELLPLPPSNWSVNAIPGGNSTVGTIAPLLYKAPATVPSQNPVAASTQYGTAPFTLVSNLRVVDELTVYAGTIFGRIDTTIQNQTQFFELSANLRFTYNPTLSNGGAKWYDGTGTAFVRGRPIGCTTDGSGTVPLQEARLQLFTEGPLAGTYQIGAGAIATVTMTCGDPPSQVTLPLVAAANAGGTGTCPSLLIGDDPGRLSGSWRCEEGGATGRANWTLRAVE